MATFLLDQHNSIKNALKAKLDAANKEWTAAIEDVYNTVKADWEASGGCKNCNGTGTVLTWWTLDGSGYDQHGTCQSCTEETKKFGMSPLVRCAARSDRGHEIPRHEVARKACQMVIEPLEAAYNEARAEFNAGPGATSQKGDYVIVVKGRNVPIGTHGVIVGFKSNDFGTKCGICDNNGKIHWTNVKNVESAMGFTDEDKKPAIEAHAKNKAEFMAKKGYNNKRTQVAI